ncbi:MAG: hypothetical protein F6K64_07810 [Moorea sp. SIO3A2]|nr:hypothetical protein [Moorena sp. SIO3A2]
MIKNHFPLDITPFLLPNAKCQMPNAFDLPKCNYSTGDNITYSSSQVNLQQKLPP